MNRTCITIFVLLICFVVPIQAQSGRQPGSAPINAATPQTKNKQGEDVVVGGEVMLATEENADTQLGKLIDNLYVRYSFGYVSTNRKRDQKFRKITLRVSEAAASREGGITVATKAGYYLPAKKNKETTDRKSRVNERVHLKSRPKPIAHWYKP